MNGSGYPHGCKANMQRHASDINTLEALKTGKIEGLA